MFVTTDMFNIKIEMQSVFFFLWSAEILSFQVSPYPGSLNLMEKCFESDFMLWLVHDTSVKGALGRFHRGLYVLNGLTMWLMKDCELRLCM